MEMKINLLGFFLIKNLKSYSDCYYTELSEYIYDGFLSIQK